MGCRDGGKIKKWSARACRCLSCRHAQTSVWISFRSCKTKRCSEMGEAAFESSHQGAPNMLNMLRLRSGQGQVKGHNDAFSSFALSGRLDGLQRGQTYPKCWLDIQKGYCISTKGILTKAQRQGQVTEGHYEIKVTNMPCDTCFLGHFAHRYRWWQSFDPMTSSNLTFDGG